jgi:hypothetical protein
MMREADHSTVPGRAPRGPGDLVQKTWMVETSPVVTE